MGKRNENTGLLETTLDKIEASYYQVAAAENIVSEIVSDIRDEKSLSSYFDGQNPKFDAVMSDLDLILGQFCDIMSSLSDLMEKAGRNL